MNKRIMTWSTEHYCGIPLTGRRTHSDVRGGDTGLEIITYCNSEVSWLTTEKELVNSKHIIKVGRVMV